MNKRNSIKLINKYNIFTMSNSTISILLYVIYKVLTIKKLYNTFY